MYVYSQEKISNNQPYSEYISQFPECFHDFFYFCLQKNESERTFFEYIKDIHLFFYYLISSNRILTYSDISFDLLDSLSTDDILSYMNFLSNYQRNGKSYSNGNSGKARKLSSLRTFFKYYIYKGVLSNNPAAAISITNTTNSHAATLSEEEIHLLLDELYQAEHSMNYSEHQKNYIKKAFKRDLSIICLLLTSNLRVSECVGINIEDMDFKENTIIINNRKRHDPISVDGTVMELLQDYINTSRNLNAKDGSALFLSDRGTRITARTVERLIKRYTNNLGLKGVTPNTLKKTFLTNSPL